MRSSHVQVILKRIQLEILSQDLKRACERFSKLLRLEILTGQYIPIPSFKYLKNFRKELGKQKPLTHNTSKVQGGQQKIIKQIKRTSLIQGRNKLTDGKEKTDIKEKRSLRRSYIEKKNKRKIKSINQEQVKT